MADRSNSYPVIEQTVFLQCGCLRDSRSHWFYGEGRGVAKFSPRALVSTELNYEVTLTEKEIGKISVELSFEEPRKHFVTDDADVQIILEVEGRRFSTDWLPLEKNLFGFDCAVLSKIISHDCVLGQQGCGDAEIKVTVLAAHSHPAFQPENPFQINRKILAESIGSDFVIVSSTGTEIKCHKSFLCAHSDVLRAMIEGSLTEAVTNKVEMVDMSDETVKAFLAFLYYWDITEASKDSEIAYELLHAAHKYDIKTLGSAMRDVFLKKDISWLSVDGAVKLFAFCRNLDNGQELKMKGVRVLKANVESLEKSECFKELIKKDPEVTMDLFKCCFAT